MHICIATITRHHRDECNRWLRTRSDRALRAASEEALYEEMAELRAGHAGKPDPFGDDDGWEDERFDIAFGPTLRIAGGSHADEGRIAATDTWRAHLAEIGRLEAQKAARAAEEAEAEAKAEEERGRALYEALRARFGDAGTSKKGNDR